MLVLSTGFADHGLAVALVKIGSDGKIVGIEAPNSLKSAGKALPADAVETAVKSALTSLGAK